MIKNIKIIKFVLVFIIVIFIHQNALSQLRSGSKKDSLKRLSVLPGVGYIWQGYSNVELTIKPTFHLNSKSPHDNISLLIGASVFKKSVTYLSPLVAVKYYKQYKKSGIGFNALCFYSYTMVGGEVDQRVTPEVGIALGVFLLSYGYNIPISGNQISFIQPHRIAIRLSAF